MRSGIIAVWDRDQEYANQLSKYISDRQRGEECAVFYSDPERLRQAVETGQISLVLAGCPVADSPWLKNAALLRLTEDKGIAEPSAVYKYQPAGQILRVISEVQESRAALGLMSAKPAARVRAVYSPLGGCLKTSFALVLGSILAEEKHCLYLNLEAHSGFRTLFQRQYPMDLSDLFAILRQEGDIRPRLPHVVQTLGALSYIPPVIWPEDIREAEQKELKSLIHTLALSCEYDEIILDVGQDLARPEEVLNWCDRIYRLEKKDAFSLAKLTEYDSYLKIRGQEVILNRIKHISLDELTDEVSPLPCSQWQRWEQLVPAVRRILAEERKDDD